MQIRINKNESTPSRRRIFFQCFSYANGKTPEVGEEGGQPEISVDGGAWSSSGVGTLVHIGNGRYYSELNQNIVNVDNAVILSRYISSNTLETIGSTAIIDYKIDNTILNSDPRLNALDTTISSRSTLTSNEVWSNTTRTLTVDAGDYSAQTIWEYPNRSINEFPGLASYIWEYESRTLTGWRQIVIDIWNSIPAWLSKRLEQHIESDYSLYKGSTNEISIISNVKLMGASNIVFSVKNSASDPDSKSILRIESLNGLVTLNGNQYTDSINGQIIVFDENTGSIKITLSSLASSEIIPSQKRLYDIKAKIGNEVKLISRGKIDLLPDITNII